MSQHPEVPASRMHRSVMLVHFAILLLATWTLVSAVPGLCTEIPLDPRRTYLHVCSDAAPAAIPVVLADLDIEPGDVILLEDMGGFDNGPGTDGPRSSIAVFSGSSTLLPGSAHPRVPDAIDVGIVFGTEATYYCGRQPTDIPEDFRCDSTVVVVPAGATHLFVCGHDSYYVDNTDPNGDYAIVITKIGTTGVTPTAVPTSTSFAVLPGRPNPFRGTTMIGYVIPRAATVSLRVVDVAGRHVRTLEESISRPAGTFTATWDGRSQLGYPAPAGLYVLVLESGNTRVSGRMMLLR